MRKINLLYRINSDFEWLNSNFPKYRDAYNVVKTIEGLDVRASISSGTIEFVINGSEENLEKGLSYLLEVGLFPERVYSLRGRYRTFENLLHHYGRHLEMDTALPLKKIISLGFYPSERLVLENSEHHSQKQVVLLTD